MLIFDYLDEQAVHHKNKIAFGDKTQNVSYYELQREAYCIADRIVSEGIEKKPIVIFMGRCVECIISMFGIMYSGNIYCVLNEESETQYNIRIIKTLKPAMIITDEQGKECLGLNNIDVPVITFSRVVAGTPDLDEINKRKD